MNRSTSRCLAARFSGLASCPLALRLSVGCLAFVACGSDPSPTAVAEDGVDLPLRGASEEEVADFTVGDGFFGLPFRSPDGLGPVYIRTNCESCHEEGLRGPGFVQKMVITADGELTPADDQSALPHGHTIRPYYAGGGTAPVAAPEEGWPEGHELRVTTRMPPTVLGRGYMEAVEEAEIERVADDQAGRTDGISGRISRVTYRSEFSADPDFHEHELGEEGLLGRFGLKARQPTLDDFAADALQGDMGMTSPLRPMEVPNPDALLDDAKAGVDVGLDIVQRITRYVRLVEIPNRDASAATDEARALFDEARCSVCHVPSMHTRADYPIALLADVDAPIYTDMLLHDLGLSMADGLEDESASASEWRTAPLIGLRFMRNYLHDGRALTVEAAIEMHGEAGSEAEDSVARFLGLSDSERAALVAFVESL